MKYIGSKRRIIKDIVPIIQKYIDDNGIRTYIEPFVGGANVIEFVKCDNKLGYDNNDYLIALYNSLQNGYIPIEFISREDYYDIKLNKEKYPKEVVALGGTLASYNGNWYRAYGGYSATQTGKDRNYYAEGVRGLLKQVPKIMDVDFKCRDYSELDIENAVIYCDPPYSSGDKNLYNKNQFNHEKYHEWVRRMSTKNIVICSEYSMPDDFECIWSKEVHKTHANQRNNSVEKLFIHNSK